MNLDNCRQKLTQGASSGHEWSLRATFALENAEHAFYNRDMDEV